MLDARAAGMEAGTGYFALRREEGGARDARELVPADPADAAGGTGASMVAVGA